MGKLVLQLPDGTTLDIPLDRERITIGRRADNDVCLPYPAVSGEHAAIVTILDDSFLEDQNSTNGTLVNGKPIAKHFLRDGDEIDIGRQKLVYYSDGVAVPRDDDAPSKRERAPRNGPAPRQGIPLSMSETMPPPPSGSGIAPFAAPIGPTRLPLRDLGSLLGEPERPTEPEDAQAPVSATIETGPEPPREPDADRHVPSVRVEGGASRGRVVSMTRDEIVVGRLGERIVAIRRAGDGFVLMPLEGDAPLSLNGAPVPSEGTAIVSGDAFELAATRIRFVVPR